MMDAIKALSILKHQSEVRPNTLTARQLVSKYNFKFDALHDWHEASNLLDYAHNNGLISVVGIDRSGMTIYKW
jgi:hypothetical protein